MPAVRHAGGRNIERDAIDGSLHVFLHRAESISLLATILIAFGLVVFLTDNVVRDYGILLSS